MDRKFRLLLVDYSEQYYSGAAKTAIPEKRSGKFVQIRNQAREYLLLSPKEFAPYHADIVERFCNEKGLHGAYDNAGKRFIIRDPAWLVIGGGKFDIDAAKRYIRLYGDSMAYGRFDSKGLKEKVLLLDEFAHYELSIE